MAATRKKTTAAKAMPAAFQFEEGGRTFNCRAEPRGQGEAWWWFDVTGDRQRYAPFHASPDDTEADVRTRIAAFYEAMLIRRATPEPTRQWGRPKANPNPNPSTTTT